MKIHKFVSLVLACFILSVGTTNAQSRRGPGTRVKKPKAPREETPVPAPFKGLKDYRTWSIGANFGVLMPSVITGGTRDYDKSVAASGGGVTLRAQFNHYLGLQASYLIMGSLAGSNNPGSANSTQSATLVGSSSSDQMKYKSFKTTLNYDWNIVLAYNLLTFDILQRDHSASLFVTFGYGQTNYSAVVTDYQNMVHPTNKVSYTANYFPVGLNMRFKVSDRWNADIGYSMRFVDAKDLDGTVTQSSHQDAYSYSHVGLEYSMGNRNHKNIDWVNPAAVLYEDLKDKVLAKRVDSIEKRLAKNEKMVDSLKVDSDNDGIADYFDKEPDSEAGAKVDGSGRTKDTDLDGIPDHRDKCPTDSGLVEYNGCPDINKRLILGGYGGGKPEDIESAGVANAGFASSNNSGRRSSRRKSAVDNPTASVDGAPVSETSAFDGQDSGVNSATTSMASAPTSVVEATTIAPSLETSRRGRRAKKLRIEDNTLAPATGDQNQLTSDLTAPSVATMSMNTPSLDQSTMSSEATTAPSIRKRRARLVDESLTSAAAIDASQEVSPAPIKRKKAKLMEESVDVAATSAPLAATTMPTEAEAVVPAKVRTKRAMIEDEPAPVAEKPVKKVKPKKVRATELTEDEELDATEETEVKAKAVVAKKKAKKAKLSDPTNEPWSIIRFEFNSSVLRTVSYAVLDKIAREMKADSEIQLFLGGHASQEGTTDYNMQLSVDRANAVKTYLVNAGIPMDRLTTKGYGEARPLDPGDSEEARSKNRRVEIIER